MLETLAEPTTERVRRIRRALRVSDLAERLAPGILPALLEIAKANGASDDVPVRRVFELAEAMIVERERRMAP
jgi:hypothetical protein